MKNGFIKVGAASPKLRVADPDFNVNELISLTLEADTAGVRILLFPELSLTSSTCGDLFYHETLLKGAVRALHAYLKKTQNTACLSIVGLPFSVDQKL